MAISGVLLVAVEMKVQVDCAVELNSTLSEAVRYCFTDWTIPLTTGYVAVKDGSRAFSYVRPRRPLS
jgi:hypothetical protein